MVHNLHNPQKSDQISAKPGTGHHIKGIRPVLRIMRSLGFSDEECLHGTGIELNSLDESGASISSDQEFSFYRRVLEISADPTIGLKIGEAFRYESYGIVGYAMLSAATFRDTISIASDFSMLTFSHFNISLIEENDSAITVYSPYYEIPHDLLQVYSDRDVEIGFAASEASGLTVSPSVRLVKLMHQGVQDKTHYQSQFGCDVEFNHTCNEIHFDRALLDLRLPQRDSEASQYCLRQCESLLRSLSTKSEDIEKVRSIILSQPGNFPSAEEAAEKLHCSVRTLRRNLSNESTSYIKLLDEIRHKLACDYLRSSVSTERISELLGYSEAANFSHAFKRWAGISPSEYRKSLD